MTTSDEQADRVQELAEEYAERLRAGEEPDAESYARAHPELASEIRRVLRAISLMEGVKPSRRELAASGASAQALDEAVRDDPERVGPYTVVRRIGRGGMGRVFEARDPDGARVALKLIHPHLLQEPQYVDRFLQEAQLGERIDHPNVVRTLATGTYETSAGPTPYLVMEYVEAQDLKGLLAEVQVVPERLAHHIGLRLAEALTALHAEGIVHRDIKPENVVITAEEDVKLMDMGVGLLLEQERRLSRTGQFVGSLLYAAPEQIAGDKPDGRTDLYALGLLLYELVAGALPFGSYKERASGIGVEAWRDLDEVSPFFQHVLRTLLQASPPERFPSSADLRDVLRDGEACAWWQGRAASHRADPLALMPAGTVRTGFHGRSDEARALTGAFSAAHAGSGQAVWIEGEAGIGKSRLVAEWLRATTKTAGPEALVVRHEPGEHGATTTPMATAIVERLGAADRHADLASALADTPFLVEPMTRYLLGEHTSTEAPRLPTDALGTGYLSILRLLARASPVVLLIEDMHFAPEQTHNVFLHLARSIAHDRVLLVATSRPGEQSRTRTEIERLGHGRVLQLAGLSESDAGDLFLAALDVPSLGQSGRDAAARAAGNPLFLLELARSWHGRATTGGTQPPVPDSIRGLFEARLSNLSDVDRELLDVAACYGADFDPLIVAAATGKGDVSGLKALARIDRAGGIIRPEGPLYRFDHHLLQEILYEAIHPALRRRLHAAIARSLGASRAYVGVDPTSLAGSRAVLIARQWLQGAEPDEAVAYLVRAFKWLAQRHDVTQIFALRDLVLPYREQIPAEIWNRVLVEFSDFELQRIPSEEILQRVEEALEESDPAVDAATHVELRMVLGKCRQYVGDFEDSVRVYEQVLGLIDEADTDARANALQEMARTELARGHAEPAIDCLNHSLEVLRLRPVRDPMREAYIYHALSFANLQQDQLDEAETSAQRAYECGRESGVRTLAEAGRTLLSRVLFRRGNYRGAAEAGEEARRVYRETALLRNVAGGNVLLSSTYMELGEIDRAGQAAREAQAVADTLGEDELRAYARMPLTRHALGQGKLAEASDHSDALQALAEQMQSTLLSYQAATMAFRVHLSCGRLEEARAAREAAQAESGEARSWLLQSQVRFDLQTGEAGDARAALDEAREILEGKKAGCYMGDFWLLRAAAARAGGRNEDERAELERAAAWARASEVPAVLAVALARLGRYSTEDLMAAKVLLERDRERIQYLPLMEAQFALWEATWSLPFLKEAKAMLAGLRAAARPEDRERLVENVALHRAIHAAR